MRKVAGEASCATLNGRMTTKSVSDEVPNTLGFSYWGIAPDRLMWLRG
jgi:hypothetical protein